MKNTTFNRYIVLIIILLSGLIRLQAHADSILNTLQARPIFSTSGYASCSKTGGITVIVDMGYAMRSFDEGESWERIILPTATNLNDVHFISNSEGVCIYSNLKAIYRTTNNGLSWRKYSFSELQIHADEILTSLTSYDSTIFATGISGRIYSLYFEGDIPQMKQIVVLSGTVLGLEVSEKAIFALIKSKEKSEIYLIDRNTNTVRNIIIPDIADYLINLLGIHQTQGSFAVWGNITPLDSVGNITFGNTQGIIWEIPHNTDTLIEHPWQHKNFGAPLLLAKNKVGFEAVYSSRSADEFPANIASNLIIYSLQQRNFNTLLTERDGSFIAKNWRRIYETPQGNILLIGDGRNVEVYYPNEQRFKSLRTYLPGHSIAKDNMILEQSPYFLHIRGDTLLAFSSFLSSNVGNNNPPRLTSVLIFMSVDGGITYTQKIRYTDKEHVDCILRYYNPSNGHIIFSSRNRKTAPVFFESKDWGENWRVYEAPITSFRNNLKLSGLQGYDIVFDRGERAYLLWSGVNKEIVDNSFGQFSALFSSEDGFTKDIRIDTIIPWKDGELSGMGLHIFPNGNCGFMIYTSATSKKQSRFILREKDTQQWREISFDTNNIFTPASVPSNISGETWLSSFHNVYRSKDQGKTWELILELPKHTRVARSPFQAGKGIWLPVYVNDEKAGFQFFRSLDSGRTWAKVGFIDSNLRNRQFYFPYCSPINDTSINVQFFVGLHTVYDTPGLGIDRGMGLYSFIVTDTTRMRDTATSVTDESSGIEALPGGLLYSPNPNPATTVLRADVRLYTGITVQQCKLGLYDVRSGKLVYDATPELQRMAQTGGRTTIEIPTAEIPSGAYLLQLTTEKSIHTRKVIINR